MYGKVYSSVSYVLLGLQVEHHKIPLDISLTMSVHTVCKVHVHIQSAAPSGHNQAAGQATWGAARHMYACVTCSLRPLAESNPTRCTLHSPLCNSLGPMQLALNASASTIAIRQRY
jgi:hypothetical protein